MLGETGLVKDALNPKGFVQVHGELWEAEAEGPVSEGETVRGDSVEGLKIKVTKIENH